MLQFRLIASKVYVLANLLRFLKLKPLSYIVLFCMFFYDIS